VRVVNHTLLLIWGVYRFSTDMRSVSQTLTDALLSTTKSFLEVNRARRKSHTTPNMGCVQILYTCEINESKPHRHTVEHLRVFLGSNSCAYYSKSSLLLIQGVSRFYTKMRFSESNSHRRTDEHHRVFLGSDSYA